MKNRFIYITGPDGSGKTTFLEDVESQLKSQNFKTIQVWIRSPKILSKPLMAYCRLVGLTKYTTIEGIKYGKHEFYKSSFVSWLFPILQLIDFRIKWNFHSANNKKNDEVLLFDRFSLDTLADLMVDTNRFDLHKTKIGRAFINLIPNGAKIVIPRVSEETIRMRKKDTLYDEHLNKKIKVYRILSNDLNIKTIDNNQSYETARKELFKYLDLDERDKKEN